MATTITALLPIVRTHLVEPVPNFWSDDELTKIAIAGIRDLWRDIVDLKQEHYLTVDITNVNLPANATQLTGVPTDVHKVYMVEARDASSDSANSGVVFKPVEYNSNQFQAARSQDAVTPTNATIYYAVTQQGAPVAAPVILTAPQVTANIPVAFCYVPTLGVLQANSIVPIPGEADNAIVAWTVAFARGKEREDRAPDTAWLAIFSTEKSHILQSLGLRQLQEPTFSGAMFEQYWS
jgi:hypothetical protein